MAVSGTPYSGFLQDTNSTEPDPFGLPSTLTTNTSMAEFHTDLPTEWNNLPVGPPASILNNSDGWGNRVFLANMINRAAPVLSDQEREAIVSTLMANDFAIGCSTRLAVQKSK